MVDAKIEAMTRAEAEGRVAHYRAALAGRADGGELGRARTRREAAHFRFGDLRRAEARLRGEVEQAQAVVAEADRALMNGDSVGVDWLRLAAARTALAVAREMTPRYEAERANADDRSVQAEGDATRIANSARELLARVEEAVAAGGARVVPADAWADLDRWLGRP